MRSDHRGERLVDLAGFAETKDLHIDLWYNTGMDWGRGCRRQLVPGKGNSGESFEFDIMKPVGLVVHPATPEAILGFFMGIENITLQQEELKGPGLGGPALSPCPVAVAGWIPLIVAQGTVVDPFITPSIHGCDLVRKMKP